MAPATQAALFPGAQLLSPSDTLEETDLTDPRSLQKDPHKWPASSPLQSPYSKAHVSKKRNMSSAQAMPLIIELNTLLEFSATDKSASALELEMLQSLYKDIQCNRDRAIGHTQSKILQIAERTDYLELKVGEIVTAHNDLIDIYQDQSHKIQCLKDKIAYLKQII